MSDPTCTFSADPYLIGYHSQYDARCNGQSYIYNRLEQEWAILCRQEFRRGDMVCLTNIDHDRRLIAVERVTGNVVAQAALMFVSPGYPLDPAVEYEFTGHGCQLLDNWRIELRGNMSFVSLVGVPLVGRSSLVATRVGSSERFRYTFRGVDRGS